MRIWLALSGKRADIVVERLQSSQGERVVVDSQINSGLEMEQIYLRSSSSDRRKIHCLYILSREEIGHERGQGGMGRNGQVLPTVREGRNKTGGWEKRGEQRKMGATARKAGSRQWIGQTGGAKGEGEIDLRLQPKLANVDIMTRICNRSQPAMYVGWGSSISLTIKCCK